MTELTTLSCPFCGSKELISAMGSNYRWTALRCNNCHARGPEVRELITGRCDARDFYAAKEKAVKAWNKRATK